MEVATHVAELHDTVDQDPVACLEWTKEKAADLQSGFRRPWLHTPYNDTTQRCCRLHPHVWARLEGLKMLYGVDLRIDDACQQSSNCIGTRGYRNTQGTPEGDTAQVRNSSLGHQLETLTTTPNSSTKSRGKPPPYSKSHRHGRPYGAPITNRGVFVPFV